MRNLVGIAGKPHARTVVAVHRPEDRGDDRGGVRAAGRRAAAARRRCRDLVEALAAYAVELREKLAAMPAKQRRGSKVQGPTGAPVPT